MLICPKCNHENPEEAKFCCICGAPIEKKSTPYCCPNCKKENPKNAVFCFACGTPLVATKQNDGTVSEFPDQSDASAPLEPSKDDIKKDLSSSKYEELSKDENKLIPEKESKTGFSLNKKAIGLAVLTVAIIAIVVLVINNGAVFYKSKPSTPESEKVDQQPNILPSEIGGNAEAVPSPTPTPSFVPTPAPTPTPTKEPTANSEDLKKYLEPWSGISITNLVQDGNIYTKLFIIDFSMQGALGGAHWTYTGKFNEETGEIDCYDGTIEKNSKFEYGTEYDCTGTLRLLDNGQLEFLDDSSGRTYTFYPSS